jgi:hypothetical protein
MEFKEKTGDRQVDLQVSYLKGTPCPLYAWIVLECLLLTEAVTVGVGGWPAAQKQVAT